MNRYILSTHEGIPAVVDTQDSNEVVFHINDIKPDVIINCLNIFNKVQDIREVNEYLLDEDDCDEDQRDYITEQLAQYAELAYKTVETTPTMELNNVHEVFGTAIAAIMPGFATEPASPAPIKEQIEKYKEAYDDLRDGLQADLGSITITKSAAVPEAPAPVVDKQKRQWTRRITDGNGPIKTQSAADFIKVMQEKIEMAKMLDGIELPEIPTSMTKANRDVMIEFQKEHSQLLVKYMNKIQQA